MVRVDSIRSFKGTEEVDSPRTSNQHPSGMRRSEPVRDRFETATLTPAEAHYRQVSERVGHRHHRHHRRTRSSTTGTVRTAAPASQLQSLRNRMERATNTLRERAANVLSRLGLPAHAMELIGLDTQQLARRIETLINQITVVQRLQEGLLNPQRGGIVIADLAAGDLNQAILAANSRFREDTAVYIRALQTARDQLSAARDAFVTEMNAIARDSQQAGVVR